MKMHAFAFGVKCGFFGASGLRNFVCTSPAAARAGKRPSFDSIAVSATEAKPQPDSQRNSRRVRPQNCRAMLIISSPELSRLRFALFLPVSRLPSIQVDELVSVEGEQ